MSLKTLLGLLPVAALVFSCGAETQTESPADSQTHWLSPCDADNDCGSLECICGYCVQPCSADAECAGTSADTCFSAEDEVTTVLCGSAPARAVCLSSCQIDDDCGQRQRCAESGCVPEALLTPVSPNPSTSTDAGSGGTNSQGVAGTGGDNGGPGGAGNGPGGSGPAGSGGTAGSNGGTAGGGSAGATGGSGGGSDPFALPTVDNEVVPGNAYKNCNIDDDCILVETTCSQCCQSVGINGEHLETYQENYTLACMDYMGPVCDCAPAVVFPRCVDGLCEAVPPASEEEEQAGLCAQTGGAWDADACGPYVCGQAPLISCEAPTPSCNCGQGRSMDEMFGCLADESCDNDDQATCEATGGAWDDGSCGHYVCGVRPACRALIPGCDCGVGRNFTTQDGCSDDATCSNPVEQALCEDTGGSWDEGNCGHYVCGSFPDCDAVIPGCDCGAGRNFDDTDGCVTDGQCEGL